MKIGKNLNSGALNFIKKIKIQEFDEYRPDFDIRAVVATSPDQTTEFGWPEGAPSTIGLLCINEKDELTEVHFSTSFQMLKMCVGPEGLNPYSFIALNCAKDYPKGNDADLYEDGDTVVTVVGRHKTITECNDESFCGWEDHAENYYIRSDGFAHYVSPPLDCTLNTTYDPIIL